MKKEQIKEALESLPALYATDGMKQREVQIVIFHAYTRWTWYVVEGEQQDDDWLLFTYCRSGFGEQDDEFGYVSLNELESLPDILAYVPEQPLMITNEGKLLV
jgi:hypothetical protein